MKALAVVLVFVALAAAALLLLYELQLEEHYESTPSPAPPPSPKPRAPSPSPKPKVKPPKPTGSRREEKRGCLVYVSIVMHSEDAYHRLYPDFRVNRTAYIIYRRALVEFAEMLHSHGLSFDFQTDWNFLEGVRKWETSELMESTGGKNVIRYLQEDLGVSIDPHSHENEGYNYADVAYLIELLGARPSPVVGGHIFNESSPLYQNWPRFQEPIRGSKYPEASWRAEILWGESNPGHRGDPVVSGVWRPKVGDFFTHDEGQRLVTVGKYTGNLQGVLELVAKIERGELPAGRIYTATVFLEHCTLTKPGFTEGFERTVVSKLLALQAQGKICVVTLPEVVEAWLTRYGGQPNIYLEKPPGGPTPAIQVAVAEQPRELELPSPSVDG